MASALRIGTRPSQLAIAQATLIHNRLAAALPGLAIEIVPISTSGDELADASLAKVGGKGLFIKELEQALIDRRVDIAVHSMKDLPARLQPEFRIAAVPERENPHDVLVTREGAPLAALARGMRLGTSSARRRFQARRLNREVAIEALRGNVDTRLKKVASGDLDAIIVAAAGLKRLGRLTDVKHVELDECDFIPCGGQAALAIETLATRAGVGSSEIARAIASLNDAHAAYETAAERAFLATLGASCVTPVGVKATLDGDTLAMHAILFSPDGARELLESWTGPADSDQAPSAAEADGARLAERMLARGADTMLADE
jgi:hydroxymethylbilane synthase